MLIRTLLILVTLFTSPILLAERATAIFAGGCFWCMEKPFDILDGVISTTAGYTGGDSTNPTYEQVSAGNSGHVEVIQVVYDSEKVDYLTLLRTFWVNIDPLDNSGQFCDKGQQYRSAIFVANEKELELAKTTLSNLEESIFAGQKIATRIEQAKTFYPAESYHQNYYKKNPLRYSFYRKSCGRDRRLNTLWLKKELPF